MDYASITVRNLTVNFGENVSPQTYQATVNLLTALAAASVADPMFTVADPMFTSAHTVTVVDGNSSEYRNGIVTIGEAPQYIDARNGELFYPSREHLILHELVHATTEKIDLIYNGTVLPDQVGPQFLIPMLADPNADWIGKTEILTNEILKKIFPEEGRRAHYIYMDDYSPLPENLSFGNSFDVFIAGAHHSPSGTLIDRSGSMALDKDGNPTLLPEASVIYGGNGGGGETIIAGQGTDYIYGGGGDDILVGGSDFLSIHLNVQSMVGTATMYWDGVYDDARDILSGGEGNDSYIISNMPNIIRDRQETSEDLRLLKDHMDFVDGSDTSFNAYFQVAGDHNIFDSGASGELIGVGIFTLTASSLANASLVDGIYEFGEIELFIPNSDDPGSYTAINDHITGQVVYTEEIGYTLFIRSNSYGKIYLGGVYNFQPDNGQQNRSSISGPAPDIWFIGDVGNDTFTGGAGNDVYAGFEGDDVYLSSAGNDDFQGGSGTDTLNFSAVSNAISVDLAAGTATGDGNDTLSSVENINTGSGADNITGSSGSNIIFTGDGVDTIRGGAGDDILLGSVGSDTYIYASGDGNDYLDDEAGFTDNTDVLILTDLIADDLTFKRSGVNLIITVKATNETVTVDEQYYSEVDFWGIERIDFADGSSWNRAQINASVGSNILPEITVPGTTGNDTLNGTWGDDVIYGDKGDDLLLGSAGSDIYIYGSGDGSDYVDDEAGFTNNTDVLLLTDLNAGDVTFARSGVNLVLTVTATNETITLDEEFYSEEDFWGIERIDFADGSSMSREQMWAYA